jgi:uncharacterized protein (TIGR01777 family)
MLRIVIPGGSGQVGRILAHHFFQQGHSVTVIARHPRAEPWRTVQWNGYDLGGWTVEIDGADVVINLAGRSVNCRYTERHRREILESRVYATRAVGLAIEQALRPPPLWINAATATIYRHALDRDMDEATGEIGGGEPGAPSSWSFSVDVATAWEEAFFEARVPPGTRRVALRSAMVMSPDRGGIFDTLVRLVRLGLGGAAAGGRQYVSWIHDADFARAVELLMERPEFDGPVNLCAPDPLPNREFMRALREAAGVRFGLPASRWMLEMGAAVLRTETELLLKSRRVVPGRLLDAGFPFAFPTWTAAARDLVKRHG